MACNLTSLGVKPKEIVAINLRTCPEWLYTAFGAMMAGAVPFGISFTYTDGSDFIAVMEQLKSCSCLVMDPGVDGENWNILSKLIESHDQNGAVTSEKMPDLRYLIGNDPEKMAGVKPLNDLLADDQNKQELPDLQSDDLAGLFQTSGSGNIKLDVISQFAVRNSFLNCETFHKANVQTHPLLYAICRCLEFIEYVHSS